MNWLHGSAASPAAHGGICLAAHAGLMALAGGLLPFHAFLPMAWREQLR
jgi:hypothetical protein